MSTTAPDCSVCHSQPARSGPTASRTPICSRADNSCSTAEIKKRYGMIYVDLNSDGSGTLERYKKKSYEWYRRVIESNGENLEIDPEKPIVL